MKYNTNDPEAVEIRKKLEILDVQLNDVISIEEVRKFEEENDVKLPDDYVWFITNVGNGGGLYCDYRHCGFFPLKETYFSAEGEDGQEKFSLDISSKGCSYSYGIILKGEHYGEISENGDGESYYYPKRVHGFKELYVTLINEKLLGYCDLAFDKRISGKIEDIIEEYKKNHNILYIQSILWKANKFFRKNKNPVTSEKTTVEIYKVFINETVAENKLVLAYILIELDYFDCFSVIKEIFIPENYEKIAFKIRHDCNLYFINNRKIKLGVTENAERYYDMILEMLKYLLETRNDNFKYCLELAVMNSKFKINNILDIIENEFVAKYISTIYEDEIKKRLEPYYTKAKEKYRK